jgi:hypothetical protein
LNVVYNVWVRVNYALEKGVSNGADEIILPVEVVGWFWDFRYPIVSGGFVISLGKKKGY